MIFNLSETNVGGGGETDTILGLRIRTYEDINPNEETEGIFDFELPSDECMVAALCTVSVNGELCIAGTGGIYDDIGAFTSDFVFMLETMALDGDNILLYCAQNEGLSGEKACQLQWHDNSSESNQFTPQKLVVFTSNTYK